jgi:2,3-bisphosphoglycerate-dependent phosphoglycerate mutase
MLLYPSLLVLVRHGESARNVAKKGSVFFADDEARKSVRGLPDYKVPLTEEGWRQAERTGAALRERFGAFAALYHSGYRRTVETAEGLLRAYPEEELAALERHQNLFIRERDPGFAYDMTTAEAEAAFPWLDAYWKTFGSFFAHPPGGESMAQVCERVALFLDILARDQAGRRVLVVTHGGTIRAFRYLLERWSYEEATERFFAEGPKNCSVTVYERAGEGRLSLSEYNAVLW